MANVIGHPGRAAANIGRPRKPDGLLNGGAIVSSIVADDESVCTALDSALGLGQLKSRPSTLCIQFAHPMSLLASGQPYSSTQER
jgi:hypothetical protein